MLPGLRRRQLCVVVGAAALVPRLACADAPTSLPLAIDLPAHAKLAAQRGQALTVLVSLPGCTFCERVRRSNLLPRLAEGQAIVQVDFRSTLSVRDWQGGLSTHDELTRLWKVKLAPTLLFFGPGGQELAERMQGAYQPDFYDAYLDERLNRARSRL